MPRPSNPDWIDWRKSEARQIIIDDLRSGRLPLDAAELTADEAWDLQYVHMPEFATVVFSQFKKRLKDHRKQIARQVGSSLHQYQAFQRDRQIHPRQTHNRRGELVFDLSPAKELLVNDVKAEKHIEMTPEDLFWSRQEYYEHFKLDYFRRRLRQQVRASKFNYYLQWKQACKAEKRGKKSQDPRYDSEEEEEEEPFVALEPMSIDFYQPLDETMGTVRV